ncbi:MAG: LamG-like jellyroll fold domain-containing protein, partial [Patescibacteria group bacterium]|nr:LamG-like jellyroll fold domain-containing protein [Patescibacteria group bacterium]
TWYYVAATFDTSDGMELFIDGSSKDMDANTSRGSTESASSYLGSHWNALTSWGFNGDIDEFHISSTARSDDWIAAQYDSTSDAFNTFGTEEDYITLSPDADQNAGSIVSFDIDGGTYTRHHPAFKIRKWRSTNLPTAVRLEGTTLYPGTNDNASKNYNASLKPISDAYFADELTWHGTMESTTADVGDNLTNGSGFSRTDCTFETAKYGKGVRCDASDEVIRTPMSNNVGSTTGTVEFWYKNTTTPTTWGAFFCGDEAWGHFLLFRNNSNTSIAFSVDFNIESIWTTPDVFDGNWHHIRLTYDTTANSTYLYVDGVSRGEDTTNHAAVGISTYNLCIGNDSTGTNHIGGIFDEFRIYNTVLGPRNIAQGGDTGDSDEYLADISDNYTLDFEADDASNRGEYLFLGSDDQFMGANYHLATQGVDSSAVFTWQYWNGTAWSSLTTTNEIEGSNNFTTTDGTFYWTQPSDWVKYSVNGSTDLYYIRGHLESGSFTTNPVESFIKTDILLFQYLYDISSDDQTFVITSEPITLSEGSIQIDVPNRYRAIMETGDTDSYISIYDRAEDDTNPDKTLEFYSSLIEDENVHYYLRWDNRRRTTILESNSLRVRVRVEGCLDTTGGGSCLKDVAGGNNDVIDVVEEYTFTTEGISKHVDVDFKDGIEIDNTTYYDSHIPFRLDFNEGASNYHSDTILYGDGVTESSSNTSEDFDTSTDKYVVLQGEGSYQDVIAGEMDINGDKVLSNSTNGMMWHSNSSYDDFAIYDVGVQTLAGHGNAQFFLQFEPQADLDTEVEREAMFNDLTNPDIHSYTTGSEWNDVSGGSAGSTPASASPGLWFDGDNDYVSAASSSDFDISAAGGTSFFMWFRKEGDCDSSSGNEVFANRFGTDHYFENWWFGCRNTNGSDPDKLMIYMLESDSNHVQISSSKPVNDGKWHYGGWVHDGVADTLTVYLDGESVSTDASFTIDFNTANPLCLGNYTADCDSGYDFHGDMDEVTFYNTALTAAQVRQNMFKQIDPTTSNLAAYWRFNDNIGTTAHDETTNNNDATLAGNVLWQNGFVPDHYNEAENASTVDASGSQINVDIDGGSNASTLINDAGGFSAGVTSITVDSTTGFDSSGTAYIEGDRFTYTGTTGTTFTGIPSSGEDSVIGHADNSVVSAMNRHKPNFKLRKYRLNNKPSTVTLEGSSLTEGTDYNIDYKPVSDAYFADELLWASTLENEAAVTSPDIGSAGQVVSLESDDYVTGKYGGAIRSNASNEGFRIPITGGDSGNFDKAKGAIEFWMQPTWDHDVDVNHYLFEMWEDDSNMFRLSKMPNANGNRLRFYIEASGAVMAYDISGSNYSWNAYDWVHLRIEWDDSAATADQQKIFINGVEPTHTDDPTDYDSADLTLDSYFAFMYQGTYNLEGIMDEVRIYGGAPTEPDDLAQGGDTSDSNEYFFSEAQDYTLDFDILDSYYRGKYLFVGSDSMFSGVNVDLGTNGVSSSPPSGSVNLMHESGNFSEYTATSDPDGDELNATAAAALGDTSYGMQIDIDDQDTIYGRKDFTAPTSDYRFRFYIDPNGLAMTVWEGVEMCNLYKYDSGWRVRLILQYGHPTSDQYGISLRVINDSWGTENVEWYAITDDPHYIEVLIEYASSGSAIDGKATLWIDGIYKGDTGGIDLYSMGKPDQVFMEAANPPTSTSGTFYLDEFKLVDGSTEIGPVGINLDWEYWDGDSWADLESISGFTDGTSNLTQDGAIYWNENPTNWRPYSVNGSTDLYYIRTSLDRLSRAYTTDPIENFIKTDILDFQYLSNISSIDQTLVIYYATNVAPSAPTTFYTNESSNGAQSGVADPTAVGDETPVFSAIYVDSDSGDVANKYQAVVYSDAGCTSQVWDSGGTGTAMSNCTEGNRCSDIDFGGSALKFDGKTYYYKIKYWDDDEAAGSFSDCSDLFTILGPDDQMRHGNYFFNATLEDHFSW